MKRFIFTLSICLLLHTSYGQAPTIIKRLHGAAIKDNLFFRNNGNTSIQYKIDQDTIWRDLKADKLFTIKKGDDHSIGVYMKFYNPLQYNLASSFKEVDDPVYLSLAEFVNAALPVIKRLSSLEAVAQPLAPPLKNLLPLNANLLLYQCSFDFINQVDFSAIKADSTLKKQQLYNSLIKEINDAVKPIDDYLFRQEIMITHGADSGKTNGFSEWLFIQKEALLKCPSDYAIFLQELSLSKKLGDDLLNAQKLAERGIVKIQQLMTNHFDERILPLLTATGIDNFKKYSAAASILIFMNAAARMDGHRDALEKFSALLKTLTIFTRDFESDSNGYRLDSQFDLEDKPTKMLNLIYSVTSLDKEGNQHTNKTYQVGCTIASQQTMVPFVSTGVFYTDLLYREYALQQANGEYLVAETKPKHIRVRPAVFLNLLLSTKSNWLYPFLQLGVTTGANDFLLPLGAGIVVGNNLSISGGALFGVRKELTNLRIGGTVKDAAALKNDLTNKGFSSWYFSINYNFFKR